MLPPGRLPTVTQGSGLVDNMLDLLTQAEYNRDMKDNQILTQPYILRNVINMLMEANRKLRRLQYPSLQVQIISEETPITVRGGVWDDDIFDQDWCNHAGAFETEVDNGYADSNTCDWVEKISVERVCDKCGEQL